jgi:hypothetical protein
VGENAASGCIVDEILAVNELRSHVTRELAISGAKTYSGTYEIDLCQEDVHGLLEGGKFWMCWMFPRELLDEDGEEAVKDSREEENDLGDWCSSASSEIISHDWWRDTAARTEQKEDEMRKRFSEVVKNTAEWPKAHTPKVHHSGPVENQGVLPRLIAFNTGEGRSIGRGKGKRCHGGRTTNRTRRRGRFPKRSDALSVMFCFFLVADAFGGVKNR